MKKIVALAYYWTYINLLVFLACLFIKLMELDIVYPEEWNRVSFFTLSCSFAFFYSPILCLYMRDKFDFVKMDDGKSNVSQIIWIALSLLVNVLALIIQLIWISEVKHGRLG